MSDTISTTIIPQASFLNSFFGMSDANIQICSMFQLKLILFIIFIMILVSCLTSLCTSTFRPRHPINGCPCCNKGYCDSNCDCGCNDNKEHFSNDSFYSYKDTVNPNYSNYQTTPLTPIDNEEGNPSNLLFGQANRIVTTINNVITLDLNIFADLFVLNGNPFGQDNLNKDYTKSQQYLVYISKNGENLKLLDSLKKENDGVYKLKFRTKDADQIKDMLTFNEIVIKYQVDNKEIILLKGRFAIV